MTDAQPCEGKFTILGMQNKCMLCGKPLKVHLPQFNGNPERVIKTPMIPEDEYMALGSDIFEDGITRVLVPLTAEDEEVAFINEELIESDKTLASIAKVTEFFEGSESPAEALASAETEDPGGLTEVSEKVVDVVNNSFDIDDLDSLVEKDEPREFDDKEKELFRQAFMNKLSAELKGEANAESNED